MIKKGHEMLGLSVARIQDSVSRCHRHRHRFVFFCRRRHSLVGFIIITIWLIPVSRHLPTVSSTFSHWPELCSTVHFPIILRKFISSDIYLFASTDPYLHLSLKQWSTIFLFCTFLASAWWEPHRFPSRRPCPVSSSQQYQQCRRRGNDNSLNEIF